MSEFYERIQSVIHDLKTPDLQIYRDRSQEIKEKHKPRNLFNQWRNSTEGQSWKADEYKRLEGRCNNCQKQFTVGNLVIDHIKPIKDFPGLAVDPKNFQLLCHDCNRQKGATHPES